LKHVRNIVHNRCGVGSHFKNAKNMKTELVKNTTNAAFSQCQNKNSETRQNPATTSFTYQGLEMKLITQKLLINHLILKRLKKYEDLEAL